MTEHRLLEKQFMEIRYRRELWKLFENTPVGKLGGVVEVGVAEGNFSEDILNWPVVFPVVYLVDRWAETLTVRGDSAMPQMWHDTNRARVMERTKRFGERAVLIQRNSAAASSMFNPDELSLVYVDADHSYEGVRSDIIAWQDKVKIGGVMAFHDYENKAYGVKKAVNEWCSSRGIKVHLLPEDKPEDAGAFFYVN